MTLFVTKTPIKSVSSRKTGSVSMGKSLNVELLITGGSCIGEIRCGTCFTNKQGNAHFASKGYSISWLKDFLKLGPYCAKLGAFVCVVFGLVNFTCMFA